MMRYKFTIGLTAAAFTLSLAPLWAQDRGRPADAPTTGSAVPRDSGSSSGSSSSGSGSSGATSSDSGSSSSGGSAWTGNSGYEAPRREPVNPERAAYGDQRRGGGTTTGRAVPRDRGDGGNSGSGSTATARPNDGGDRQPAQGRSRAVPTYSRPRDGRNVLGTAIERPDGYYRDGRPYSYSTFIYDPYYSYYYDPYYRSRYYWSPWGYGFGFGYMAYDPFLFGTFGYSDYYADPYLGGGGYYGGGGYSSSASQAAYRGAGSLRLKVKPAHAQVFVDGYLVGDVDSFDGVFQRLNVEAGSHRIELRAEGYETTQFEVMVIPGKTITYEGDMRRR
jgi:hypothetical protein